MAYVKEIKLRVELLQNLGEYTSIKPVYELTAELDEEDDETVVMEELENTLLSRIKNTIDHERQERGLSPIYALADYFVARLEAYETDMMVCVMGKTMEHLRFLREWIDKFEKATCSSLSVYDMNWWLLPYAQKKFEMLKQRSPNARPLVFADLTGPTGLLVLDEVMAKYKNIYAEFSAKQEKMIANAPGQPADVDNGYEEMDAIQQHSDPDGPDDEWEHPDDPDHSPLRHLYDEVDDTLL